MKRIDEYISDLRNYRNIIIKVIDGELKVRGSKANLTSEVIDEIKERKSEIISFYKRINKKREKISLVKKQTHYALSHAQKRLWVLEEIIEVDGLYNVPLIYTFDTIDIPSFDRAIKSLIKRHEILRTTIEVIDGEPRQCVQTIEEFNFQVIYKKKSKEELDYIVEKEIFRPFDLSKSPIRATLIESNNKTFVFTLILHHIVTDGWSTKVLLNDFLAFYNFFETKSPLGLPDLRIQYKDYSYWQYKQLKKGELNESKDYWYKKLSGGLTTLKLPLDFKRGVLKEYKGAGVSFEIDNKIVEKLMKIGTQHGASLFMIMTSIVKILLYRYTGQEDIIVGTPVNGRNNRELENQVGFYSNTIVLRSNIKGTYNFHELLNKVSSTLLEGYKHQFYPYDLLVEEFSFEREINRNPLFDVMVSMGEEVNKVDFKTGSNYTEEILTSDEGVNKFDITYSFLKFGNGVCRININYNTSLFKKEKMIRMSQHLRNLSIAITESPTQKIVDLEYLSVEEKNQILNQFNNTFEDNVLDTSFKELIENQVRKTPNAISIISSNTQLTFHKMNVRANRLANYLSQSHNVQKGDYVGVLMNDTIDRMVTLLSIIKLGGIYVPIDLEYPQERKRYIIKDTCLSILITDESSDLIDEEFEIIDINSIKEKLNEFSERNPDVKINSEDIFSLLYTSGSTGNPKGVMVKNKGLVNRINWLWKTYDFNSNDVIYQKTPIIFDVSIGELFMPLCFGAKLLIVKSESNKEISSNIKKYGVTYVHFSPSLLNKFLELEGNRINELTSLRFVFASGEELLRETVNRYYKKFKIPLINLYGPVEASIEVSVYNTRPDDKVIPIGKPISNVYLYILDKNNKLLPIGIHGEIGIGGVCLAKGYLNKEVKTSEQFIHNTYHNTADQRIYKTGDIGFWNSKGEIEFIGRRDGQIRMGGNRIEPGEIEGKILEHPEIKEVAVVVNEDSNKNSYLVAYYVKRTKSDPIINLKEVELEKKYEDHSKNCFEYEKINKIHYKTEDTISELFEKSVAEHSNSTALIYENGTMSYATLNSKVNHFASILKLSYQVGNGDLIGVIMNRTEKVIITILAILKTGATYVPIDSEYPENRINQILDDSGVKTIILDEISEVRKIERSISKIIYDDNLEVTLNGEKSLKKNFSTVNDICYICYTSGSTGSPKGVMVKQYSVVDYVNTFIEYFELNNLDTVIQQSSISFDTSIEEIFPILCIGGKLVIFPEGGRDIDSMIKSVNTNQVTVLSTTPLVISELNSRVKEFTHHPRIIISGGDELRDSYVNNIPDTIKLYNTYGPTETTVCVSFAQILKKTKCNVIGTPIKNHWIYLLDDNMKEVSHGSIGEIYVVGAGVAKGYLNKEEETNQNFLSNPFGDGSIYKTGDLAKLNNEGQLEFYGRKDNQVKIRGYRVEPLEVDTVIQLYKNIINSYTITKTDANENKHLITYYKSNTTIDLKELRSFLKDNLPHYMIPSYFIKQVKFPLTSNGKINIEELPIPYMFGIDKDFNIELKEFLKTKLPAYMVPTHLRKMEELPLIPTGKVNRKELEKKKLSSSEGEVILLPQNDIENKLLKIWQSCLNQTEISTDRNFFEIGGNSLKAIQMVKAIYKELNFNISLKDIYNNPTITEVYRFVESKNNKETLIVKLNEIDKQNKNIFFIPPIIGSSTIFQKLAASIKYYNIFGIQYKGFDKEESFDSSIKEMAVTFIREVLQIEKSKKIILVAYSMGVPIAFEMSKILEKRGFNIKLIFIDRGVKDNKTSKKISKKIILSELNYGLGSWFNEIDEVDKERIVKLILNNSKILNEYKVKGKIKSNIRAIEANQSKKKAKMSEWNQFTYGNLNHSYIEANHYGILNKENLNLLARIILNEIENN